MHGHDMITSATRRGAGAAAALLLLASSALAANNPAASSGIQGVWKLAKPQTMLTPLNGQIPFTTSGQKEYDDNKAMKAKGDYDDYDITTSRCSSPGVPRLMLTPERFKIWPWQRVVTFDYEWNRAIREVDMSGVPTDPPLVPNFTGTANGHWEGKTLVITTTDISERTLIDDLVPHTDAMKVTERLHLLDPNMLEDRITIDDPQTFTRPWDAVLTYKRQPDAVFPEDICLDRLKTHQPAFPSK